MSGISRHWKQFVGATRGVFAYVFTGDGLHLFRLRHTKTGWWLENNTWTGSKWNGTWASYFGTWFATAKAAKAHFMRQLAMNGDLKLPVFVLDDDKKAYDEYYQEISKFFPAADVDAVRAANGLILKANSENAGNLSRSQQVTAELAVAQLLNKLTERVPR